MLSVFGMAWNFVASMARVQWARWRGYQVVALPAVQGERYARCQLCEFCMEDQCRVCGCLIYGKIALNTEQCPKKHWPRVWIKASQRK